MPFALLALSCLISGWVINLSGASYANTQRILKAIEMLSQGKSKE
jgi:hypothetical protein